MQRWFLALDLADAHHFNQAVLLAVRDGVAAGSLAAALGRVVAHHAALGDRRPVCAWDALDRQTGDGGERPLPVPRRDELPAQLGELSDKVGR